MSKNRKINRIPKTNPQQEDNGITKNFVPYVPSEEDMTTKSKANELTIDSLPSNIPRKLPFDPDKLSPEELDELGLKAFPEPNNTRSESLMEDNSQEIPGTQNQKIVPDVSPLLTKESSELHKKVAEASYLPSTPKKHPILEQMLNTFGLAKIPEKFKKIENFNFGFRKPSAFDSALAIRIAASYAKSEYEYQFYLTMAKVSVCMTTVNSIPVCDVFGITVDKDVHDIIVNNATNPPIQVVEALAPEVMSFITQNIDSKVLDELSKGFQSLFKESEDDSYSDFEEEKLKWRFECTKPGCEEVQIRVPTVVDAVKGEYLPVYCPVHGTPMTPISSVYDYEHSSPLD